MAHQYPATYNDIYGQEEAILEIEPNGEFWSIELRTASFRSLDLDGFEVWPSDQNKENLQRFEIDSYGDLIEYTLQWSMPLQIKQQGQITQAILHCDLERKRPTEEHRYGFSQIHLSLHIDDIACEVTDDYTSMGPNLLKLQKQLPQNISLNCCQFCTLSAEDLYSPGLRCYRQVKQLIRAVKHLPVRSKVGHPINQLWDKAVWIQEAYICPEFEEDMLEIERARKWGR